MGREGGGAVACTVIDAGSRFVAGTVVGVVACTGIDAGSRVELTLDQGARRHKCDALEQEVRCGRMAHTR